VLIFESGFNCDWYIFRRSLVNIVVLAGPGVLLGAVLLGTALKLAYSDLDMNWPEAFTLGSVLSATDPVAVVALLKELGASVRFNTLVEGESLLNDGTAMVFYLVFI
jgi:NhaP-type Na+/H+ or K+/H+ antiporter